MERQISFGQYRTIDLTILAVVLTVTQALICVASNVWFKWELYVVSPVAVITALVMMRWGPWAAIHAVLGGVVFTLASGGNYQHILIYSIGNLAGLGGLLFFKWFTKEGVRTSSFLAVTFALAVQVLMLLGRALMALVMGHSVWASLGFITTDLLSVLFTCILIWICRRVDGLFEDQKHYLLRIQEEKP